MGFQGKNVPIELLKPEFDKNLNLAHYYINPSLDFIYREPTATGRERELNRGHHTMPICAGQQQLPPLLPASLLVDSWPGKTTRAAIGRVAVILTSAEHHSRDELHVALADASYPTQA